MTRKFVKRSKFLAFSTLMLFEKDPSANPEHLRSLLGDRLLEGAAAVSSGSSAFDRENLSPFTKDFRAEEQTMSIAHFLESPRESGIKSR